MMCGCSRLRTSVRCSLSSVCHRALCATVLRSAFASTSGRWSWRLPVKSVAKSSAPSVWKWSWRKHRLQRRALESCLTVTTASACRVFGHGERRRQTSKSGKLENLFSLLSSLRIFLLKNVRYCVSLFTPWKCFHIAKLPMYRFSLEYFLKIFASVLKSVLYRKFLKENGCFHWTCSIQLSLRCSLR